MTEEHFNMHVGPITPYQRENAELAHELMSAFSDEYGPLAADMEREARSTAWMATMGQMLWGWSYKHHPDDDYAAFDRLLQEAQVYRPMLAIGLATPQEQIQFTWMARWADQGFPQVTMGHKYCAALLATAIHPELLGDVASPWKAFMVALPNDLLFIKDSKGKPVALTKLLVQQIKTDSGLHWNFLAMTDSTLTFWRHGCQSSALVQTEIEGAWDGASFMLKIDEEEDRVAALLGRLVINVCLAMSNPENYRAPKTRNKPRPSTKHRHGAPEIRTFQLGKPIELDCREAIKDYVFNGPKKARNVGTPSVQVLVRGHWKPRLSARVGHNVWVEPYWRGPEDAPILARPHVLKNEAQA